MPNAASVRNIMMSDEGSVPVRQETGRVTANQSFAGLWQLNAVI
jgi:hypothetical protein